MGTIVYNLSHLAGMANMIALSERDQGVKVLLTYYNKDYEVYYQNLLKNNIFNYLVYYDNYKYHNLKEGVVEKIDSYFCQIMRDSGIDLADISKCYVCQDVVNNFLIFAAKHQLPVESIELSKDQFLNDHFSSAINVGCSLEFTNSLISSGFLDGSKCNKKYLYSETNPIKQLSTSKIKDKVLSSFLIDSKTSTINQILIMSSGFWSYFPKLCEQDSIYLYQLILDYFTNKSEKTLIKLHPNDQKKYYYEDFDCSPDFSKIPLEFYALIPDFRINAVYQTSTTSEKLIKSGMNVGLTYQFTNLFLYFMSLPTIVAIANCIHSLGPFDICQNIFDDIVIKKYFSCSKIFGKKLKICYDIEYEDGILSSTDEDFIIILPNNNRCTVGKCDSPGYISKLKIMVHRSSNYSHVYDYMDEVIIYSKASIREILLNNCQTKYNYYSKTIISTIFLEELYSSDYDSYVYQVTYPPTDLRGYIPTKRPPIEKPISIEYQIHMIDCCAYGIGVEKNMADAIAWGELSVYQLAPSVIVRLFKLHLIQTEGNVCSDTERLAEKCIEVSNLGYYLMAEYLFLKQYSGKSSKTNQIVVDYLQKGIRYHVDWRYMDTFIQLYPPMYLKKYIEFKTLFIKLISNRSKDSSDDLTIIKESMLFDKDWYAIKYGVGSNPEKHYLTKGWKEGNNPSRLFNTAYYLENNLDVKNANMCPLVHYERYGKYENRCYWERKKL